VANAVPIDIAGDVDAVDAATVGASEAAFV
jgi:hypothetical protein